MSLRIDPRADFRFGGKTYLVEPEAYTQGMDIQLPDGTILKPTWDKWGEILSVAKLDAPRQGVVLALAYLP